MSRKLVTIRTIGEIQPIKGIVEIDGQKKEVSADSIETAVIDGWECVIRKADSFKEGEKIVYFETDSFLPIKEPFLFLEKVQGCHQKNKDNEEGFKIRIQNMGPKGMKQVSNGLVFRPSVFKNVVPEIDTLPEGSDLTQVLGIKVFEKFVSNNVEDMANGYLPSSINITDQERIQNLTKWFQMHKQVTFEVTEKIDGESTSFILIDGKFIVGNRTLDLKNFPGCKQWEFAINNNVERMMRERGKNIAIQGELAGPGIQDNRLQLKKVRFFVFDIWDIDNRRHFTPSERIKLISWLKDGFDVEHVPIVDENSRPFEQFSSVKELVVFADGKSLVSPDRQREGLVFKSNSIVGKDTISFKVLSNTYMLKNS